MGSLSPSSSSSSVVVLWLIVACALNFGILTPASAQSACPVSLTATSGTTRLFTNCTDLRNQGSTLSWNYLRSSSNALGATLDVAFRTTLSAADDWAGWGINLEGATMIGTNTLIAFNAANGSNVLPYKLTAPLKRASPPALVCSPIDIEVLNSSVVIDSLVVTIFATIRLPANLTIINQVWNRGPSVTNFSPAQHPLSAEALSSYGTLDIASGAVTDGEVANQDLKNNHGIVSAISWGILFPLGIMATRYIRPFTESLWFFIHVPVQVIAYILAVTSFGMGLKLEDESSNVRDKHKNLGITLVTLATLQITALVLRPKPDHKLRWYWNVYHHGVGYLILVLGIVNIFEGFEILDPKKKYKHAYIGVICALAAVSIFLEIVTWAIWLRNRSRSPPERLSEPKATNGRATEDLKGPTYDGQL